DMWDTIQSKKTWKGKIKNLAKDGSEYIVDATIVPVLDRNNTIIEYIGLRNDVTELEQYKELLQVELDTTSSGLKEKVHTLAEYERAIDESNAFTRTDTKGRLTYVNDKFCKINGYSRDELLGKPHSVVRHPDMPKAFFKRLWDTIKAKKIWKGIIKNKTKSGKATYMDTTIIPMLDAGGRLVEYMSIRHEVTELIGLQHEIEDTQKEVVYTMGAIGESRSKETGNHVKRVAEYSKVLAKLWGMEEQQAQMLRQASPMHDIGKVAIPDAILNKPGKLDAKEWKTMQTHAKLGYNMLKHSKRKLLQTAAIVAHEHHERWEGGGYPRNLRGEDIHIYGRITAVADVFDALGSDRCYKKAWSLDKILDLFRQERGKQFDPVLIDLFLENIDTFIQIRNRYRD
ncbi:MAG: HD domain-containing phosphohydrolase, partial [Campylobacterota bacterium]